MIRKHSTIGPSYSFLILLFGAVMLIAGCGESQTFPPTLDEYARNTGGRCLARVWGIQFTIEETGTEPATYETTGTLGGVDDDSAVDAQAELVAGDVTVRLSTNDRHPFDLEVNGKSYGRLISGNKVVIDKDRNVTVNNEPRAAE